MKHKASDDPHFGNALWDFISGEHNKTIMLMGENDKEKGDSIDSLLGRLLDIVDQFTEAPTDPDYEPPTA